MVRDPGPQAGPRSQMHFDVEAQCILGSHVGNVVTRVPILIVLHCTSQPGCISFPLAGFSVQTGWGGDIQPLLCG